MTATIRVVIAEDSLTIRHYLKSLIDETADMRVVGEARNGAEAVQIVAELKPDVVSMDIKMPVLDGLEATRQIMATYPTPVVVVSGLLDVDVQLSLQALEAGALAVVGKPPDRQNPLFAEKRRQLLTTLRAMSAVKVVSRRSYNRLGDTAPLRETQSIRLKPELIAIGSSTGGPSALHRLLRELPEDLGLPVVIAQHMPDEFMLGLVRWLSSVSRLKIQLAQQDLVLEGGMVVFAQGATHLTIQRHNHQLSCRLVEDTGQSRYQPSVDVLLKSVAETCQSAAIGVLLTGMGDDGAAGLLAMRHVGAYTIAQDEASSIVFGMPRAAIELNAAQSIESLGNIAAKIVKLVSR